MGAFDGSLPPGLRGFVAGQQANQTRDTQQLQMLGLLANMQNQQAEMGMKQQLFPLQLQKTTSELEAARRQQGAIDAFASILPDTERPRFLANPSEYIKEANKKYVVGRNLVTGTGSPMFTAPQDPHLVTTGVPGQPGFTQSGWAVPGSPEMTPVGAPKMPDILNPDVQKAREKVAQAGASRMMTNVNAYLPASEEAQRDFIKSSRSTYDQLKQAPVALQNIEQAKTLIPGAKGFMGPGGESLLQAAKFLNNRLGTNISTEGVKDAEELRTRIFFNIMDNLKKMDAQPSQQQQQIMQEALGKLGTDPGALPRVLDAFGDVIKEKVTLHNREVSSAVQRGVKFPYDPIIDMRQSSSQPAQSFPTPNTQAIGRLKMRPSERDQFESIFGPGSADRYLKK